MNNLLSQKATEAILDILCTELDVRKEQLTEEADLVEDLGADSLAVVEITLAIEDRLDITIPDERSEKVRTVGDLFQLVSELLQNGRR